MSSRILGALTSVALCTVSACSDSVAPHRTPARLILVSGDGQQGEVGTTLPDPIAIQLVDSSGAPVSGQTVYFRPSSGGTAAPSATTTDAQGMARAQWTLGTSVFSGSIVASLRPPVGNGTVVNVSDVAASAVVRAGPATQLIVRRNDPQIAAIDAPVAVPPTVLLRDRFGNPTTGTVSLTATGGGSVSAPRQVRDSVSVEWTLGSTPGANTLQVSLPGIAGSTVTFAATAYPRLLATDVAPSADRLCALDLVGAPWCWGTTYGVTAVPLQANVRFASLAAGNAGHHVCGLTSSGAAYCWGDNVAGQLGDGTTAPESAPTPVSGGLTFRMLAAGNTFTCGLTLDGTAYCWGSNIYYQLGDSTRTTHLAPTAVRTNLKFQSIATGFGHTCALSNDGTAYCWGLTGNGQAGARPDNAEFCNGSYNCVLGPTAILRAPQLVDLTAGSNFNCGRTAAGALSCWGGSPGQGANTPQPVVDSLSFTSTAAGGTVVCGLTASLVDYCFASVGAFASLVPELGRGTAPFGTPVAGVGPVVGTQRFTRVFVGGLRACGIASDHSLYCWGQGPVGGGSTDDQSVPRVVVGTP